MITCINLSKPRRYVMDKIDNAVFEYKMLSEKQQQQIRTSIKYSATMITIHMTFGAVAPVYAGALSGKIIAACQPIIELIQGLGYPVCLCTMTAGGVTMAFNRRKGMQLIKDGAIAYVVIQFVPMIMNLLVDVGAAAK